MPQNTNYQYNQLIIKIKPTELKKVNDVYTAVGNNDKEKFSLLINAFDELKQKENKIIYLKTTDFDLEDIKGPTNYAEVNFKKYFFSKNIFRRVKINSFDVAYVDPSSIEEKILLLRFKLEKRFQKLLPTLKFNTTSLLLGLNENDEQNKIYLNDFSKLGIIHLFSLSGMHLMLLVSFIKKVCSISKICTTETLEILLFLILPIYCVLVGTKTSICRATILILEKIVIKRLDIKIPETEIFGIGMICGLFFDPKCLLLLGGQLTYLLSFALIYLKKLSIFKLSFAINMLCMPLIIFNNYEINILTIPINVFMTPIFEWIILPTTLIVGIVGNIQIFEIINRFIYDACHQISNINSFSIITGKISNVIVIVLMVCGLIMISDNKFKNKFKRYFIIIFTLSILINKIPLSGQVTLIDVGQGDSILITTPIRRKVFLIDTGGKLNFKRQKNKNFNVDKITIPYLKSQGISKIDGIFLSHQDADHIGDLGILLQHFNVDRVYFGEGMQANKKIQKVLLPYVNRIEIKPVIAGQTLNFDNICFNVLAPTNPGIGENKDSMVLQTRICDKNWLFTGDLNREKELEIANSFNLQVDYLKVGHHGSKTSTDPKFINQIKPEIAFISVGKKNRYGHPNKETIETLKAQNVKIIKTSQYGMIKWNYWINSKYKLHSYLGK
ncbi:DNA internalization-related competence protein ComEC/Rec2 [Companilactobacillus sp. DQM5]|uniref:DNA internalization-related competence protein ComEC/Rec2 n=1 Tax=Companilactobacillus sp. DQM5 TaxID=3463359 RepID=UPI0040585B54